MFSLGMRLKLLRQAFGINQEELASKLSVTSRTLQSWEKDKISMSIEKAEILVKMGANPSFILCGIGEIIAKDTVL